MSEVAAGLVSGAVYALLALPFALALALGRWLNLAHGELVLLGGYVGYTAGQLTGWPPALLAVLGAAAVAPLGLALRALLRRVREPAVLNGLVLSFGLALCLQNLMLGLWSADYRLLAPGAASPPRTGALGLPPERTLAAAISLAVFAALWLVLTRTRWGVALRATGRDAETAALMGVDTDRLGALTFAAAGALAGGSGVLLATFHYLQPAGGVEVTLLAVTLAILAGASDGVGRLPGVLPAGLLVGLAESLAVAWAGPRWRELVVVALLLAVLVARAPRPGRDRAHP